MPNLTPVSTLVLLACLLTLTESVYRWTPTWITSPYIKADCANVIANRTGNTSTPTATIPYPGTPFNSTPHIGYGAFIYNGDDGLASECFQINRTSVTATSFSVLIKITGFTHINILNVRFIAIDSGFPHYVSSFDNVPVNYSAGPLVNISDNTSTTINIYYNTINFTQQSAGNIYNHFSTPLAKNKIVLFLTSLFLSGTNEAVGQTNVSLLHPVTLQIGYEILTNQTYQLVVQLGILNMLERLHFSMVVFDQTDIEASKQYMLIYGRINLDFNGGFVPIPQEFVDNFMIGFTNFTSERCRSIIFYTWSFATVNGTFGLSMPVSVPLNAVVPPVTNYGFSYLYIKTWNCSSYNVTESFFDPYYNMCTECPIINCVDCFNITVCSLCDYNSSYVVNQTTGLCQLCSIVGCVNCSVSNSSNATDPQYQYCTVCNTAGNYRLVNGTCEKCLDGSGYFVNPTSMLCQLCTLSHCLTCASLNTCLQCDINNSYALNTSTQTCHYCNISSNTVINPTTQQCTPCPIAHCLQCLTLSECQLCDQPSNYFLDNGTCSGCSVSNCADCLNLTACFLCDAGYLIDNGTLWCQTCTLSYCDVCQTLDVCRDCSAGFMVNTSGLCQACSLDYCVTCFNLSACGVCNVTAQYFINTTTLLCQLCAIPYCITCSSLTACSLCDTNQSYFLNTTSLLCQPCTLPFCLLCHSLTSCSLCDTNLSYFLNPSTILCQLCQLQQCLTCQSLYTCSICNESNQYFLNGSSLECQPCAVPHCLMCLGLETCGVCDQSAGWFLNTSNGWCWPCAVQFCLTCQNLTECQLCDQNSGYFLNTTSLQCEPCTLPYCLQCLNLTSCSVCNTNLSYFLNSSTFMCQPCTLQGCLVCQSLSQCSECDSNNSYGFDHTSPNIPLCGPCNTSCTCNGYTLPWNPSTLQCSSLCGDGLIRVAEECDDGNTDNFDGCSDRCIVESYAVCAGEPSICNITIGVSEVGLIVRKAGCNVLAIDVEREELGLMDDGQIQVEFLSQGIIFTQLTQTPQKLTIKANHTKSLINTIIGLKIGSTLYRAHPSHFQPLLLYSPSQCQTESQLQSLATGMVGLSYITLALSLASCKINGLELFGVLQLAYFSIISYDFVVGYLEPVMQFKALNGFNTQIVAQEKELPPQFQFIGFSTNFINNCNIMFFIMLAQLALSLCLLLISHMASLQKLQNISQHLLKQGFLTVLLFNLFNISFSAGAHLKYASPGTSGYEIGIGVIVVSVGLFVGACGMLLCAGDKQYGEFVNKFKDTTACKVYVPFSLIFRVVIGVYCATHSDQVYGTLIALAFSLAFILYSVINLPFKQASQNYRANFLHIVSFIILLVANYYRGMKANTPLQIKGYIMQPAILIFLLVGISVLGSLILVVVEIVKDFRKWWTSRKDGEIVLPANNQLSLQTIN